MGGMVLGLSLDADVLRRRYDGPAKRSPQRREQRQRSDALKRCMCAIGADVSTSKKCAGVAAVGTKRRARLSCILALPYPGGLDGERDFVGAA
jgi:hypothetical protein